MVGIESEAMYSLPDPSAEDPATRGECVKITQVGTGCDVVNTCKDSVRKVRVSILGSPSKCGSFTTTINGLYPGTGSKKTIKNAFFCKIKEDSFMQKFDS